MSLRGAHNYGLKFGIPEDEEVEKAISLVEKYRRAGRIPKDELEAEVALTLYHYRLALPLSAFQDSLAWRHRFLVLEDMEIPYIIRFLFEYRDCELAIVKYFSAIGEESVEDFVRMFDEMLEKSKNLIVCGEDIVDIAMKYGIDGGVVIAEMKGAGLIRPTVGCGGFGRAKAPLYEINRFFAMVRWAELSSQHI